MYIEQVDNESGIYIFFVSRTLCLRPQLLIRHEAFLMVIYDHHKIVEKETDVSGCV